MQTSSDGRTLRFRLRRHVVFHDGSAVRAGHVVSSLERLAKSSTAGWIMALVDSDATAKGRALAIKATGPHEIEIRLKSASQDLLALALATPQAGIVRSAQKAARGVGSGPFRLGSRRGGQSFRANRDYFDGPPYLDEVVLLAPSERDEHIRSFQLGQSDASLMGVSIYGERSPVEGVTLLEGPSQYQTYLIFNTARGPMRQRGLRQAVSLAIDRRRLSGGQARPGIMPGARGSPPHNPSRAQALVSSAPASGTRPMTLLVERDDAWGRSLAPLIRRDLAEVGLAATTATLSPIQTRARLAASNWDFRLVTIAPASPDELLRLAQALSVGGQRDQADRLVSRGATGRRPEMARALGMVENEVPMTALCVWGPRLHYRTSLRAARYDTLGRLMAADMWLRPAPRSSARADGDSR